MKGLPNIDLTYSDFYRILSTQKIKAGSEGAICHSEKDNTVYKFFMHNGIPVGMSENKEKKIRLLYDLSLPYLTNPISTISMSGSLIGYEMPYDKRNIEFPPFRLKRKELLHVLKETRKQLEFFSQHDIIYGDVAQRNILINHRTGEVKFCDVDNMGIRTLPIDIMSKTLREYHAVRGIDEKTDAYMHSIMTLNSFDLDEEYCSPEEFSYYFEEEGKETLQSLRDKSTYNGEYIIQYVKKK